MVWCLLSASWIIIPSMHYHLDSIEQIGAQLIELRGMKMQADPYPIDAATYRKTLGHFATGVTVITTVVEVQVHGMTANGFVSVSLDPPLVLISVGTKARMHALLGQSGFYGVSVLARDQEVFSRHFAGRPQENLEIPFIWRQGCPLLDGAVAQLVCRVTDPHPAGDHTLFIGQVTYLSYVDQHAPLLFYSRAYKALESEPPVWVREPSWWDLL